MKGQLTPDQGSEVLECAYGIEAIAQLMQKAFENLNESSAGIYGSAVILERNAKRIMELLGEHA